MTTQNTIEYVYFVHGIIHEIMAGSAQRRVGFTCRNKTGLKIIKCPCCGGRLTDVEDTVKVELYRNPAKSKPLCHSYIQCKGCKGEIGVMIKLAC